MKLIIAMCMVMSIGMNANSQSVRKPVNQTPAAIKQRGSGQYHGNRDTTPGSPMGTGGAGGDMSGSPAASAIETDDQTSKAVVPKSTPAANNQQNSGKTILKKTGTAKRTLAHKKQKT